MAIDRAASQPVYEQIAGNLRRQIMEGLLAPFVRLETEAQLMRRYGVSRVTATKAMHLLLKEGLIVRRRAKGTFVAGPQVRHDLSKLAGFYETLVAQGVPLETKLREFRLVDADERVRAALQCETAMRLERSYSVSGTPIALSRIHIIPEARQVSHAQAERLPCYGILRELLGHTIARADVAIRAQRADAETARLLGLAAGEALLVLDRVSYDEHDVPLEISQFCVRPEAYEFTFSARDGISVTQTLRSRA